MVARDIPELSHETTTSCAGIVVVVVIVDSVHYYCSTWMPWMNSSPVMLRPMLVATANSIPIGVGIVIVMDCSLRVSQTHA